MNKTVRGNQAFANKNFVGCNNPSLVLSNVQKYNTPNDKANGEFFYESPADTGASEAE